MPVWPNSLRLNAVHACWPLCCPRRPIAKSPLQLPYTSGIGGYQAAYAGSGTARAKPVHGPSEPSAKGQIGAADDDETSRGGTSRRWRRAHYRLVVSVRKSIIKSVRGRNLTTNAKRYQVDSPAKRCRFGRRNRHRSRHLRDWIRLSSNAWEVQDLLADNRSTDTRGLQPAPRHVG